MSYRDAMTHGETNAGLGMVPHKTNCRCNECELDRLQSENARIRQGIKTQVTAENLHEIYERLAPDFGYETREETRDFDPNTPNGKLMMAVCAEIRLALLRGEGEE